MKTMTKVLVSLGAGLVIGGVLGVLFAPRKGKETREKLKEQGSRLKEKMQNSFTRGKESLAEKLDKVEKSVDELI